MSLLLMALLKRLPQGNTENHQVVLRSNGLLLFPIVILLAAVPLLAAAQQHRQHEHFHKTLPADKLKEIRALKNPLPQSSEILIEGEEIYNGKGGCANCHGQKGDGNGPMAADLTPPPRNFQHGQFWSHHTEGEIFWVIKHGAQGTAMPAYEGLLTDREIWAVMRFLPTFVKKSGKGTHHGHGHTHPKTHKHSKEPSDVSDHKQHQEHKTDEHH